MDPKIIASLLIILGTVSGQNDPITEVFDQIFYLHSQFEGFQDTTRLTMGVLAGDLNGRIMDILENEIASWQRRVLLKCPKGFSSEAAGEILRSCSEAASREVLQLQSDVFNALDPMAEISNDVSISIVRELAEFNIVLNYDTFVAHFDPIVADYQARLDTYAYEAGMKLVNFILIGDDLPERTEECIGMGFKKSLGSCL